MCNCAVSYDDSIKSHFYIKFNICEIYNNNKKVRLLRAKKIETLD